MRQKVYKPTLEAHEVLDYLTSFFMKWREDFASGNQIANHFLNP